MSIGGAKKQLEATKHFVMTRLNFSDLSKPARKLQRVTPYFNPLRGEHMKKIKGQFLLNAAVAGILGASSALVVSSPALADDDASTKGHCVGANACKGKSGCAQTGQNDCAGKNGCKGKGYVEKTKAECDKMAKKNKKVHFEPEAK